MKISNLIKLTLASSIVTVSLMAGDVIAVVNGSEITKEEMKNLMKADYDKLTKEQQKQAADMLSEREIIYQEAKTKGFEKDPNFQKTLDIIKKEVYINFWRADIAKNIVVTEEEAKSFYDKNLDKFKTEAKVLARHILVKTEKEAKDIVKDIDASATKLETFKTLAKTKSINGAETEGNLGWFTQDKMVPEFAEVAFSLKKDTYSKTPVKTQFGYHVIYVEDKKEAGTATFEEVKKLLMQQLKLKKANDEMMTQLDKLKAKAKIEIK